MRRIARRPTAPSRIVAAVCALLSADPARADPVETGAVDDRPAQSAPLEPDRPPSIQTSLGAFGDPGGLRSLLAARGIDYNLLYTNEVLGNVSGGVRRGAIHAGKFETAVTVDFDRLAGWTGWSGFANVFQIHDTGGLRDRSFQRLITVSNIEAYPSTRLSELWLERTSEDRHVSLRIGQLVADGEFFASETGKIFLSNDWPTITGANLPSGGPAYPISTPGMRLRWTPDASVCGLLAIFNGDPGDQASVNRTGLNFRLNDAPLLMGEIQFRATPGSDGLGRTLKLGGYRHFGRFEDVRYDRTGLPLANPRSSGVAHRHAGTSGAYAVMDAHLYRPAGGDEVDGISAYARLSTSPSDRNLIDLWADGGIVVTGMVPGRPRDAFGLSFIYARIGANARRFDLGRISFSTEFHVPRSYEATIEATYLFAVAPGWTIQPDIQYIFNPGGGTSDPLRPGQRINGGAVFGLRSTLTY
ncbi:carbohydrate porin [Methylobacterium sp. E-045]|uniref:carbohydrate porin n=1 Tax=Methylobacterium sp. E-045 TaxID=2836575 RepID=UPI001FBB1096|nr:carbohydrate porin [Methylobacterium sp. E-045]MCJ2131963.1 carbohydrate porin [Methylobacterium sp. E-045]